MLSQGYSVNLYMFHGGTTFGFMNGANFDDGYKPQTTSYDYDAALDESGHPTPKYYAFRAAIASLNPTLKLPDVPDPDAPISIPRFPLYESSSLVGEPGHGHRAEDSPVPMEMLGQSYGYILYRTHLTGPIDGELRLDGMHDYAEVFVNGSKQGTLDSRLGQHRLNVHSNASTSTLDILVENGGRVNFKKRLREERKGITGAVTLSGKPLHSWQVYRLPMNDIRSVAFKGAESASDGPSFLRGTFMLAQTGDSYSGHAWDGQRHGMDQRARARQILEHWSAIYPLRTTSVAKNWSERGRGLRPRW